MRDAVSTDRHPRGRGCASAALGAPSGERAPAHLLGRLLVPVLAGVGLLAAGPGGAETSRSLNFYGVPGLIDMPSGESAPDGMLTATVAHFGNLTRGTLSFQFSPRLSGSFRYARFGDWNFGGFATYFDRSFDLRFRLVDEGRYLPSITVGLQDLAGTGVSSAEYIAATKTFGDRLKVTAGLGWGRLASRGSFGGFGTRTPYDPASTGGNFSVHNWFRGPMAPFGGIEYAATDRLTFKLEYSSDAYDVEDRQRGILDVKSPLNVGVSYRWSERTTLGAYYLYGTTLGFSATFALDPKQPAVPGTIATAPLPIKPRDHLTVDDWSAQWVESPSNLATLRRVSAEALTNEGMLLEAMSIEGTSVSVRVRNLRYDAEPMAIGRAVRALTNILPPSVETFTVVPVINGMAASAITVRRSDLERNEFAPDGTERMLESVQVSDALGGAPASDRIAGVYPRLSYSLAPEFALSIFDPRTPFMWHFGVNGQIKYEPAPGFVLSAMVSHRIRGNYDKSSRVSNSVLPHVRSDGLRYAQEGKTALERLTAAYYFRPGPDLYGRVTAGYLERMFAGVSAEVLWKRVDSNLAFGIEANYVQQRDFDGGLGLRDYSVATGHVSAYYAFGREAHYLATVRAGRYLAGDWGATLALDREFANGWKVGAFATLTNVSHKDFGEGSFDKGIYLSIPLSWALGKPSRAVRATTLRPLVRDGGAILDVDGRLFETVRGYHSPELSREWGMFWR